jgi:hypothetical protein
MSIEQALELFAYYHARPGQGPLCLACGRAEEYGGYSPTTQEIRARLGQLSCWWPDQIADEITRLVALRDANGNIHLCENCWEQSYFWRPGAAECLHRKAYRRRGMTQAEFHEKFEWASSIAKSRHRSRHFGPESLAWMSRPFVVLRVLQDVFVLNNPEQLP